MTKENIMSTQNTQNTPTQTPTPSTLDSWENRILNASTFLGLSIDETIEGLKKLGVEKEPAGMEMLSDEEIVPFGDLRKVYCDDLDIPIAKVRMAMKYLRGSKESKKTDSIDPTMVKMKEKYGVKLKLEHVPTWQLLEDYDPTKKDHPITLVLLNRYNDEKVIIFRPDTTEVDVEATADYITDLDQGFPQEAMVQSQGEFVCPMAVGDVPDQVIEEDPLFPNSPLKRGRSIVNRSNWANISIECRQFARIAVETDEIDPHDKRDVKDVMKLVNCVAELDKLKEEYPRASVIYRERKKLNSLPNLAMTMKQSNDAQVQNPFGVKRSF
jgi:hypothetical protein